MSIFSRKKSDKSGRKLKRGSRIGLEIGPDGVAVALVDLTDDNKVKLLDCEYIPESDPLKQRALLLNWSSQYSKRSLPCVVTLHPADYQLLLIEPPDVPEKDAKSAMNAKLRDLLNYSVDQAVYDVFKVPEDAYRGRINMAYVAVSPKAGVKKIVSMVNKNGMNTDIVSIREISYRNIILNNSDNRDNVICVWLDQFNGSITLVSDCQIYFSRRLEKETDSWDITLLQKEIERSIDYSINQLGRMSISKVEIVLPEKFNEDLVRELNSVIETPVEKFVLSDNIEVDDASIKGKVGSENLAAIGAAAYPVSIDL